MKEKTLEQMQSEIEDHQSVLPKVDGQTWFYRLGNRVYGAMGITLPLFFYYATDNLLCAIGIPLVIDGVGDVITGKHHCLSYKLLKAHPRNEIERLEKQIKVEVAK